MFFQNAREAVAVFYVFFDLFCASIIGILLYTTLSDVEHTNKRLHLVNLLSAIILYCVADSIWVLAYSNVLIPCTVATRYLTNIIAYSVMTVCTYTICRFFLNLGFGNGSSAQANEADFHSVRTDYPCNRDYAADSSCVFNHRHRHDD